MADSELYKKGEAIRRKLRGEEDFARNQGQYAKDPVMKKFIDVATETVFGSLWTRPGLDIKTRTLICVVSDAATGRYPELDIHLRFALKQGWTEDELTEVLLHLTGYVGVPIIREAMLVASEVFTKREGRARQPRDSREGSDEVRTEHGDARRLLEPRELHGRRQGGRARGLRFPLGQRPSDRAGEAADALPLYRQRRFRSCGARPLLGSAGDHRLPRRLHRAPAFADVGAGGAAPAGDADREDAGNHRRARQRQADRRCRRGLDEGGIRASGCPLRGPRQGHRRVPRSLPRAVDQGRSLLPRRARAILRRAVLSQASAEAAPADLGRRREPGSAAARGEAWRCLVSRATTARRSRSIRPRASAPALPR